MAFTFDQKWVATGGIALGGALAALAASDTVPPQIAAYSAIGVLILGMFGMYHTPAPAAKVLAQSDQLLFHPKDKPSVEAEPKAAEPPSSGTSGRHGLP